MIYNFIENCIKNTDKTAFVFKNKKIKYGQFLKDVYKMVNFFKQKNLQQGSKALLFVLPCYEFYVLLFACLYYGINIFVLDNYKNKNKIYNVIKNNGVEFVFCNNFTFIFKNIFPKSIKVLNVSKFYKSAEDYQEPHSNQQQTILTTFTSGTTGESKPINRSINFLKEQMQTIFDNIDIVDSNIVFCGLPIYTLFVIYSGKTCVLGGSIRKNILKKHNIDTIIAPISLMLKAKGKCNFVKKTYCGGARLYNADVQKLTTLFPLATRYYIYGASECALIATTNLDYYILNNYAMQNLAKGISVSLLDEDENKVGKICVMGQGVLSKTKEYISGDLGYLDNCGLHIVGRSNYSTLNYYNYLLDDEILLNNPKVKCGFTFVYKQKIYFCFKGRITCKKQGVIYVKFYRLPRDAKHKTKLDYNKTIAILEKRKKIY